MPEFVALADLLRAPFPVTASIEPADAVPTGSVLDEEVVDVIDVDADSDIMAAAREARLFRARLGDAFDAALARMLRELAAGVLARELRLAPCDVTELARRALERGPVVRLRLAPADAERGLQVEAAGDFGMPVVADPSLQPGDAVFELAGGSLDARLGVRLAIVLEALAADAGPRPEAGR